MPDRPTNVLSTTETSIRVFEAVKRADGARLVDIRSSLDMSKSAVHKHLNTLIEHCYIVREGEQYHVGLKLFHIGEYARYRKSGYRRAEQRIQSIARQVSHVANFSVLEDGRNIVIFSSERDRTTPGFQAGRYDYAHSTAAGKSLLAERPDDEVDEIIDQWGLPKLTSQTITTREELFRELETIRQQGFATNVEETIDGLTAVAVSVSQPGGGTFGAFDVSAPVYRFSEIEEYLPTLKQIANEFASELDASDVF